MVLGSTDGWGVLQGFCENEQKTAGVVMDSWLPWQLGALDASFPPPKECLQQFTSKISDFGASNLGSLCFSNELLYCSLHYESFPSEPSSLRAF